MITWLLEINGPDLLNIGQQFVSLRSHSWSESVFNNYYHVFWFNKFIIIYAMIYVLPFSYARIEQSKRKQSSTIKLERQKKTLLLIYFSFSCFLLFVMELNLAFWDPLRNLLVTCINIWWWVAKSGWVTRVIIVYIYVLPFLVPSFPFSFFYSLCYGLTRISSG